MSWAPRGSVSNSLRIGRDVRVVFRSEAVKRSCLPLAPRKQHPLGLLLRREDRHRLCDSMCPIEGQCLTLERFKPAATDVVVGGN
jgi:hypothetical protein